jgi:hypothetical protein
MINDPLHAEEALAREKESGKRKLLAVVCAVAVTAILLIGYGIIRKRYAERILAENTPPPVADSGPKGPPLAHIVIDEPTLEKGTTTIGGVVRNISKQELSGLTVVIELRRRKDGGLDQTVLAVTPTPLQPEQEGSYSMKVPAQEYASIRLAGLKADPQSALVAYTSAQGKKRTPERVEPRSIIVKRSGKPGEFINSPDNPGRIP